MWSYLRRDVTRTVEMLRLPYAPPNPDPIEMNVKSGAVSKDQPYIARLTRLGVAAAERGNGLELLKEVSAVIFGGTRDWHLGDHLARQLWLGLVSPPAELDRAIETDADRCEATIADNEAAQNAGHLGRSTHGVRGGAVLRPGSLRTRLKLAHDAERAQATRLVPKKVWSAWSK